MHLHDTPELIFVADGVFTDSDGDGVHFQPGHVLTYAAGSSHSSSYVFVRNSMLEEMASA